MGLHLAHQFRCNAARAGPIVAAADIRLDCPMGTNTEPRFSRLRLWARALKRDVVALYLASRDPRVPWWAKCGAGLVAAYALSPIDLIPDFIPVIGYLDDLIFVPLGILLVVRLIPPDVMADLRVQASLRTDRPISRTGAIAIVGLWSLLAALLLWVFWPRDAS